MLLGTTFVEDRSDDNGHTRTVRRRIRPRLRPVTQRPGTKRSPRSLISSSINCRNVILVRYFFRSSVATCVSSNESKPNSMRLTDASAEDMSVPDRSSSCERISAISRSLRGIFGAAVDTGCFAGSAFATRGAATTATFRPVSAGSTIWLRVSTSVSGGCETDVCEIGAVGQHESSRKDRWAAPRVVVFRWRKTPPNPH